MRGKKKIGWDVIATGKEERKHRVERLDSQRHIEAQTICYGHRDVIGWTKTGNGCR